MVEMLQEPIDTFEPLSEAIDRVAAGIALGAADQRRPGSPYLKSPPLTTREREWADRARLALRLIEVVTSDEGLDLSPSLDPAMAALRAIVGDAGRAVSHRA
ncbi:hypothetical protein [Methylobacterium dankookense]|uniref:Uncharacterized protein n=1 Tax=Methylobacterium dankookense TaxID=560405 RepID=A0A564G4E2_9HYPH|nr:hypothetical protein [Methylobacterium dankookense]GJD58694.1 hypothetical protein IFDJLNFL_4617 [Methylobacterium dankookense]VUF15177.1 hypothetical protein MTDSW087_04912 [Methylobacterium dankookense]